MRRTVIEIVERTELGRWADAWDELVLQLPLPTPFLRSWWLRATAEPSRSYLLCLDGDALVGGLAWYEWRRVAGVPIRRLAGAGTLCPDHLDLLRAPGREHEVVAALRTRLSRSAWVLDADGLVEDALLLQVLPRPRVTAVEVAPYEPLPGGDGRFLAARSRNYRRSTAGAVRRFAAQGVTHRRVTGAAAGAALDRFAELHRQRGDREALLAELPRLRRAVLAGIACGEARVDVLAGEAHARAVAVDISFQVGGALRMYQTARRSDHEARGAGPALLVAMVDQASAEGCVEVDLLRGDEAYKDRVATRRRVLLRARAANGLRGRLLLAVIEGALSARRRLRRPLPDGAAAGTPTRPTGPRRP